MYLSNYTPVLRVIFRRNLKYNYRKVVFLRGKLVGKTFMENAKYFFAALLMILQAFIIRICDMKNQNAAYPVSAGNDEFCVRAGVTLRDVANDIYERAVTGIDS